MERSLKELNFRRALCLYCLQTLSEIDSSDPRKEPAIAAYNQQLASIDAQIAKITGHPPDTVIGLKPAILFAKPGEVQ